MKTFYLDTWAWIDLEEAAQNDNHKLRPILNHLHDLVKKGKIQLPLSLVHCEEMIKHGDKNKRKSLWEFATKLSGCFGMKHKMALLPRLIDEAVYKVFDTTIDRRSIEIFTRSGLFGIGIDDQFPNTKQELMTEKGWIEFWTKIPKDNHDQLFKNIEKAESVFIQRRNQLKRSWREEDRTIRRKAYIGRLFLDYQAQYLLSMRSIGRNEKDFEDIGQEKMLQLITEVPPFDVEVSLAVQHQQQWDILEKNNDIRDIKHLCMAIPYCDVVITEKYWVDKVKREKLDMKYNTVVSSDLNSLFI